MTPEQLSAELRDDPVRAARAFRRWLLGRPAGVDGFAAVLPVALPRVDDPGRVASLAEEAILLGVTIPAPAPGGPPRLGWALADDGVLVPVFAAEAVAGRTDCPWDPTVRGPYDWLCSPARIVGMHPELVVAVREPPPLDYFGPLTRRVDAVRLGLAAGGSAAAAKLDDLAELLARAAEPVGPEERLEALASCFPNGALMLQAAAESLFYGADAELWAARLDLVEHPIPVWSTTADDGRPRLLHTLLAEALTRVAPGWPVNQPAVDWLRKVAASEGRPAQRAREALSAHRVSWFSALPQAARADTLRTLADASAPLDSPLLADLRGLTPEESALAAAAWRARVADPPEVRAWLGAVALAGLSVEERGQLVPLVETAPERWRVGVAVELGLAAGLAGDAALADGVGSLLEALARGGTLAVPAAIGLARLVQKKALGPVWLRRLRRATEGGVGQDPRVQRELDLAS